MTRIFIIFIASIAFISCKKESRQRPPNIIYIMADDLGYGDLGCYGQKQIKTPRIDRLAEGGMKFTDHYSGHTVCRPSRLVLWTGRHSGHTPIYANMPYVFKPGDVTVAELLKEKGYVTGGVGKWAMGNTENEGHPNKNGFDFWMGYLDQSEAHNYYPAHLWRNYDKVMLPGNVLSDDPRAKGHVSVKRSTYAHHIMTNEALDFIKRNKDTTFLLHVHWTLPHANNEGGRLTGNGMEIPGYGIYKEKDWPEVEKGFAAMVSLKDRDVGRIVDLLKQLGIEENTIVFVTSDNGPHGEGGHDHNFFNSNGPLRGFKRDLYEGGIRIPMIAYWPGHIRPGSVTALPSAFWDFLPTACEIAGIAPPENIDGISYLPTLLGGKQKKHEYLYWKSTDGDDILKIAVRMGRWKALQFGDGRAMELYDLSTDIAEENNIAAQHPEIIRKIKAIIESVEKETPLRSAGLSLDRRFSVSLCSDLRQ